MQIAITGATSMIGVSIIQALLKRNQTSKIYAIVRCDCNKLNRLPVDNRINIVYCNVDNYSFLSKLIKEKCDVFYHIAWSLTGQSRNRSFDEQAKNIQYTLDAVKAAADLGCELFVGAGSQAEYGLCKDDIISPDSVANPIQAYGIAKYAAGKLAMQQSEQLGMNCVWVRIFSVYGIWEKPTTLIQTTIQQLKNGDSPKLTDGIQLWDYLYSEDAGEAFVLIGEQRPASKIYCLGSGKAFPLRKYILEIQKIVNPSVNLLFGAIPYSPNSIMKLCADISLLTRDTGWKPKTDFVSGITQTYRFLESGK